MALSRPLKIYKKETDFQKKDCGANYPVERAETKVTIDLGNIKGLAR